MSKKWNVAKARQELSRLIQSAAREPQAIYRRDRLVAAVIDPDTYAEFEAWRSRRGRGTIADAFAELRALCSEEGYRLQVPRREDRRTPFDDDDEPPWEGEGQ